MKRHQYIESATTLWKGMTKSLIQDQRKLIISSTCSPIAVSYPINWERIQSDVRHYTGWEKINKIKWHTSILWSKLLRDDKSQNGCWRYKSNWYWTQQSVTNIQMRKNCNPSLIRYFPPLEFPTPLSVVLWTHPTCHYTYLNSCNVL